MVAPCRAASVGLDRSVLLLEPGMEFPGRIYAAFDGGAPSAAALRFAARFARGTRGELNVLLLAVAGRSRATIETAAREIVEHAPIELKFEAVSVDDPDALRRRARGPRPGLLVMSSASLPLDASEREQLIDRLGGPLLLVR
jgi:hypothetical protein